MTTLNDLWSSTPILHVYVIEAVVADRTLGRPVKLAILTTLMVRLIREIFLGSNTNI